MTRLRRFPLMLCLLGLTATPAIAQISPVCKPVLDAEIALTTTPYHAVSTESDGKTVTEIINADGANYVKTRGVWRKSPLTPQDDLARQQDNIKSVKVYARSRLPDDRVDANIKAPVVK